MGKAVDLLGVIGNDRVVWSGRQGRAETSNPPGAARWCGRITEKAHVESGKQDHTNNHNKPQMLLFERMVFVVCFILVTPRSLSFFFSLSLSMFPTNEPQHKGSKNPLFGSESCQSSQRGETEEIEKIPCNARQTFTHDSSSPG